MKFFVNVQWTILLFPAIISRAFEFKKSIASVRGNIRTIFSTSHKKNSQVGKYFRLTPTAVAWDPLKAVAVWDRFTVGQSSWSWWKRVWSEVSTADFERTAYESYVTLNGTEANHLKQLNQGLVRLSMMYGWCLTEHDLYMIERLKKELLPAVSYMDALDISTIMVALEVAYQAHNGQRRKSGEAFINHPLEVAKMLGKLRMDANTVVAGLLHDTVEDTPITLAELSDMFGADVASIFKGDTKASKLSSQDSFADLEDSTTLGLPFSFTDKQAENLRCMLLAMSKDARVVVVKLADRLHNMRTLGAMPPSKQQRIAAETMSIFVPLARRLGMWPIKSELENLCFSILCPAEYKDVNDRIERFRSGAGAKIQQARRLELFLKSSFCSAQAENIRVDMIEHSPYSIWKKSQRDNSQLPDEINPFFFKILFKTKEVPGLSQSDEEKAEQATCYKVLDSVHTLFRPTAPLKVKDYIAFPKTNGYRALHTCVLVDNHALEVQIRTYGMERVALFGLAALWREDQLVAEYLSLPWLEVARTRALGATPPTAKGQEFAEAVSEELQSRRFVLAFQGGVSPILANGPNMTTGWVVNQQMSTGEHLVAVKVNGRQVPLNHPLRDGDIVCTVFTTSLKAFSTAETVVGEQPSEEVSKRYALSKRTVQAVRVNLVSSDWPCDLVEKTSAAAASNEESSDYFRPVAGRSSSILKLDKDNSAFQDLFDLSFYRLAELKHGRMSIVFLLLMVVPGFSAYITEMKASTELTPFLPLSMSSPTQVIQVAVLMGIGELAAFIWKMLAVEQSNPSRSQGRIIFNSLLATEVAYGRLAMIGVICVLLQALSTPIH